MITPRRMLAVIGDVAVFASVGGGAVQNVASAGPGGIFHRRGPGGPAPARVAAAALGSSQVAAPLGGPISLGLTLIVTSSRGWVQCDGAPIEDIPPGDVVWFRPGEKALACVTAMTHIAIQEARHVKNVNCLEKVSDEQYRR